MTINIALVTNDSIVLGCDSLSSAVETVLFPFRPGNELAVDSNGDLIFDAEGRPMIPLRGDHMVDVAVTVLGGVNKMFCLYEEGYDCRGGHGRPRPSGWGDDRGAS